MLAELLDARAALVQPRQRHQVMVLVVPLAANRDMGLDEPGVIDRTLAPAQIDVGFEAIQAQLADAFGPPRIAVVGAFHGPQHRDRGVLRRRGQVGVERVVKVRDCCRQRSTSTRASSPGMTWPLMIAVQTRSSAWPSTPASPQPVAWANPA